MLELTEDEKNQLIQMQRLINSGDAWRLEGSYGRACMENIKSGLLMLGYAPHKDYWGNIVPRRGVVADGFPGSFSHVANVCGEEWAETLAALG